MRYFIEIAYKGTNYHGWQLQENANTVQAEVNKALSILFQVEINVTGAGRTDTGVHAKQFYAHFDIENKCPDNFVYKLNRILPNDIACKTIIKVNNDAHARFDATSRTYNYIITLKKNPFLINQAYFFPRKLDINSMNLAAKKLLGTKDFSCFSKSKTQTFTNNCNITNAEWKQVDETIVFTITADRFLRNMVRAIVGTLIEVGECKIPVEKIDQIIASKNRSEAGTSVPGYGLFLTNIIYPYINE